jgi:hypothetical protein
MQIEQVRTLICSRNSGCCRHCAAVGRREGSRCSSPFSSLRSASPRRAKSASGLAVKSPASAWASSTPKENMSLALACSPPAVSTSGAV